MPLLGRRERKGREPSRGSLYVASRAQFAVGYLVAIAQFGVGCVQATVFTRVFPGADKISAVVQTEHIRGVCTKLDRDEP